MLVPGHPGCLWGYSNHVTMLASAITETEFRVRLRGHFFMRQSLMCASRLSRRYVSSFGIQGADLLSHDKVHFYEEERKPSFSKKIWKFFTS
jgi:hypothetical protein